MNKLKRCGNCGSSEIKKIAGTGLALPWRDYPSVRLIEPFECLRCQHCNELLLNASQLRQLDNVVEQSITANIKYFIQKIVDREKCEQREIAIHIGLSPEYLSEIKSGRKIPSFQTFNFLKILALDENSFTVSSPDFADWKIA
jgi:hypothetical protein